MRHARTYEMLKAYGHSPVKALEIVLDASRGDRTALQWIGTVRMINRLKTTRGKPPCGFV